MNTRNAQEYMGGIGQAHVVSTSHRNALIKKILSCSVRRHRTR